MDWQPELQNGRRGVILPRVLLRTLWACHETADFVSGGRLSTYRPTDRRVGMLFMRTTGRRNGQPRRTGLNFIEDGPNLVVVASNAGADRDPGWWRNLQAQPEAIVELERRDRPVRARRATEAERARLWPEVVRRDRTYDEYARATSRPIPVVILEPREATPLASRRPEESAATADDAGQHGADSAAVER
jgi:deazaflavin-dependent oxidoreductase (nitroreductase family)